MATSEADICNAALLKIGHTQFVASLDIPPGGETTLEVEVCNQVFDDTRDEVLADYHWPFATRRNKPAALGGSAFDAATTYGVNDTVKYGNDLYVSVQGANTGHTPDASPSWWRKLSRAGWAYAFMLPADCVHLRGIYPGIRSPSLQEQVPCDRESDEALGQLILTDVQKPELVYTARIEAVAQYPASFVDALAWKLASKLAAGLKKDPRLMRDMVAGYELALGKAVAAAERERTRDLDALPPHIAARW